ncbi:hypothetical protein [Archangium sp.]|uniref:hypothetical protein n=1 Tax=Archangium sp. TaxID=1872627 RepID=UPI002ED95370
MRKLMMAVVAVTGLGLVTGCQDKKAAVQEQRQEVAEAQREAAQTTAEVQRDAAKEQAEAQQDVREEQRELAELEREQSREQLNDQSNLNDDATGGSGMTHARTEEVEGTIQSASGNSLALIVPDKNNQILRFQTNAQVQVMRDDKPVALTDLKAGDEVRASYMMDPAGKMVLKSIEVEKESAQHPGKQKK